MMVIARIASAFGLLSLSLCLQAGVYTWKDANGITHFSDEAPGESSEAQEVQVREPMTVPAVSLDALEKADESGKQADSPTTRPNETPGQAVWREKYDQIQDVMRQVKKFALPSE